MSSVSCLPGAVASGPLGLRLKPITVGPHVPWCVRELENYYGPSSRGLFALYGLVVLCLGSCAVRGGLPGDHGVPSYAALLACRIVGESWLSGWADLQQLRIAVIILVIAGSDSSWLGLFTVWCLHLWMCCGVYWRRQNRQLTWVSCYQSVQRCVWQICNGGCMQILLVYLPVQVNWRVWDLRHGVCFARREWCHAVWCFQRCGGEWCGSIPGHLDSLSNIRCKVHYLRWVVVVGWHDCSRLVQCHWLPCCLVWEGTVIET